MDAVRKTVRLRLQLSGAGVAVCTAVAAPSHAGYERQRGAARSRNSVADSRDTPGQEILERNLAAQQLALVASSSRTGREKDILVADASGRTGKGGESWEGGRRTEDGGAAVGNRTEEMQKAERYRTP